MEQKTGVEQQDYETAQEGQEAPIHPVTGYPVGTFAPGQECNWCTFKRKPGLVDRPYCCNPKKTDLVHAYGFLRITPLDGGESCKEFDFDWRE